MYVLTSIPYYRRFTSYFTNDKMMMMMISQEASTGILVKSPGVFTGQTDRPSRSAMVGALFVSGESVAIALAASVHELATAVIWRVVVPARERFLTRARVSRKTADIYTQRRQTTLSTGSTASSNSHPPSNALFITPLYTKLFRQKL